MIKLQDLTPEVYYKESRDFQFLGRLYDLVLNSVKTESELIYNLPLSPNVNEKMLELLTLTLGFKPKHQYNSKQLYAICSVLSEIIRNKGSIKALEIACKALFSALDISQELDYDFTPGKGNSELNLYIAQEFSDITLITDLLNYILPAGMSCNIVRELHLITDSNTMIGLTDTVTPHIIDISESSNIACLTEDNLATYSQASGPTVDTDTKAAGLQPLSGFSVNSEIIKLNVEEKSNGS